jgi:hypothetical protein
MIVKRKKQIPKLIHNKKIKLYCYLVPLSISLIIRRNVQIETQISLFENNLLS